MSDRLAEIQARLEAATPGPWFANFSSRGGACNIVGGSADSWNQSRLFLSFKYDDRESRIWAREFEANSAFIAHAPADIRRLLDENERLRADGLRVTGITGK